MKKETLEEAVNAFKKTNVYTNEIKQKQERMYSEEEVKHIIFKFTNDFDMKKNIEITSEEQNKWFEQHKKK